jgi:hypothetical protein
MILRGSLERSLERGDAENIFWQSFREEGKIWKAISFPPFFEEYHGLSNISYGEKDLSHFELIQ